ncbi:hypothetical protein [Hymenobacter edaphi]|uniref:Uncharacterized protein n=1 Tax=Hymenobacter edaphi TaxID=2211146 RepID=A0A328BPI8_9BACT|nr:hypothetical protein [Hymenobacter edaphi]RAK68391.1 hypothetical protein DLM85_10255 [Hymenobacter edaphi]
MRFPTRFLLGLCGLGSCAAPRALPPGSYLETRPNTVLFTSRELVVYPDGRIRYFLHTDDVSMGREGSGTYRLRPRRLELRLSGPPDTTQGRATSTPLPPTDRRLQFYVSTQPTSGQPEPLQGLTVLARNAAGAVVAAVPTDAGGYAELPLGPAAAPRTIEIAGQGWRRWRQPWPAGPTLFRVQLVPQPYQAYAPGTRKTFALLAMSPLRLVLRQGPDTLTLVRRP